MKLRQLKSNISSVNNDKAWRTRAGPMLQSTAWSLFATSLAFVLGIICPKLVSVRVFESYKLFYDGAHLLFSGVPIEEVSLVLRVSSESHPSFTGSLNVVAIDLEEMKGAVACVQFFVCNPLLAQEKFFSETWINMLNTAFASADAVQHGSSFDFWRGFRLEAGPLIVDLKACREKVLMRMKTFKDTRERWFGVDGMTSSVVGNAAPRIYVRISDVAWIGDVQ